MNRPPTLPPIDTTLRIARRIALLLPLAAGCGGRGPDDAGAPAALPGKASTVRRFPMKGVVRAVDRASGLVTIRHDEIPGFMKAMTMPFDVPDRTLLDDLAVEDEVEGTLEVSGNSSKLIDLLVTRPAPAPGLTLDLSGGAARMRPSVARLEPGQPVPDFAFTNERGVAMKLSDLRGKVVALTFIYTRCPLPEFCPALDLKFSALADRIEAVPGRAESVRLLSISFDPENDTPDVLRKHGQIRGSRPPLWSFAVASHEELRKVAEPLGLVYGPAKDEIIHNRCVAVIAPDGTLARLDVGEAGGSWTPSELLKTIHRLIPESSR